MKLASGLDVEVHLDHEPVLGAPISGRNRFEQGGKVWFSAWSGTYDGIRPSSGKPYFYVTDGYINDSRQSLFGFPVEQIAGQS